MKWWIWSFALGFTATPALANATELGDAAAALAPGEWVEFSTVGYGHDLLDACDGSHSIFEWANKGVWDPDRREVRYVGQGHYSCRKQIRLDEVSNTWDQPPEPPGEGIGHGYEHNAIDVASGTSFYRHYGSASIVAFDPAAQTWSDLPDVPTASTQVASAITYFPEAGGLLFADSVAGVWLWSPDSNAWSQLTESIDVGPYNIWAVYNPAHGIALLGGGNGSTSVYVVDPSGSVTATAASPEEFGIARAAVVPDPATGHYLAFADSGATYELDAADLDSGWWDAGSHPVMDYARDWRIFVPISTHGVIMAATWDFEQSNVLLYRHAETEPPPPPGGDTGEESGEEGGSSDGADATGAPPVPETSTTDADTDAPEASVTSNANAATGGSTGAGGASEPAGCSCRASHREPWPMLVLLLIFGGRTRRSRS